MSAFLDEEAEVSSGDDEDEELHHNKKRKRAVVSDDDEDEDGMDEDLKDLIDDAPIENEDGDDDDSGDDERDDKIQSDIEEDLSDDDYALLEENLGHKVARKVQKRKRIKAMSDGEESGKEEEDSHRSESVRGMASEMFDGDDDNRSHRSGPHMTPREENVELPALDEGDGEESDPDDFIVDESDNPISMLKKKKSRIHDDAALQEAQDIFGVDFDFEEFEAYGDEYLEENDDEDEYDEEMVDGEPRPKKKVEKIKMKKSKTTIFDVFEPSELEKRHFTDLDQDIRTTDMPERFQLRRIPVSAAEDNELEEEANWIFNTAFITPPISQQEFYDGPDDRFDKSRRMPETIDKIRESLKFMRNQHFEVPLIAFYRKEYVEPELKITDLWKIFHYDEKWMQLNQRKQNLLRLFDKMQQYQFEIVDAEKPLDSHFRTLTQDDIDNVKKVKSPEELRDVYQHFLLYYGTDIPKMKKLFNDKEKSEKKTVRKKKLVKKKKNPVSEEDEDPDFDPDKPKAKNSDDEANEESEYEEVWEDEEEDEGQDALKQATRKTGYTLCQSAGLAELARKFGLTPEEFAENLRDNYQRHEVNQDPTLPSEVGEEYICTQFRSNDEVLRGARHMVAMQIAYDPTVRQCIRQTFFDRAMITIKPTKRGVKEIDETHNLFTYKYLKNKPVRTLVNDQFVKVFQGQIDGLLTYDITIDATFENGQRMAYFDEIKSLYQRDEFSELVQEWNNEREMALERALNTILYPQICKELINRLKEESKEHITRSSCLKLYNWLRVAPYQVDQQLDEDDDDFDTSNGLRILGISYVPDRVEAAYGALIDGTGECIDFIKLSHLLVSLKIRRDDLREAKEEDLRKLKAFISQKKPHVIAVSAESREALMIMDDIKSVIEELEQEQQMAPINVELVDNELAIIYQNSNKGEADFREYPALLRQAISLSRRLQDPLIEFCQLCNSDDDLIALKFHPLQDLVPKDELSDALILEFVNRVNEVGVDVNRCVEQPYTASLVQFICGFGPRKGSHLIKQLKQQNSQLENRTQLVTMFMMGAKVFYNCAGFIKIDTNALGDSTEIYIEVLDGSRVHPETYEWARKMAVDALEYDESAVDANPAGALEEILESPERLKDLDLDAFAVELERQGYGNKHITLYDIRAELNHRYKDLRTPYRSPSLEERFNLLTKETPQTFFVGKLVTAKVFRIVTKRPHGDQLDQANPERNVETGLWQCPFCLKNEFSQLSEVWNHFDAGECPGKAVGVKCRLDNGILGFLHVKNISDKRVNSPEERVKINMMLHTRITKIDINNFSVDLTSKTSDLVDSDGKWKAMKDAYYSFEDEEKDRKVEEDKRQISSRQTYVKRVISHPSFRNVDFKTVEKLMEPFELGEVIIRPSSKGSDHLTVTWKVAEGILQHIDVKEESKENDFSLGKILMIDGEEFEDLDEIIARHIQPMASIAREIMNYKYYIEVTDINNQKEAIEVSLLEEKKKAPNKIPYFLSTSTQHPGKFLLSYMPRKSGKHEYATVRPDGIKFRGVFHNCLASLVKWFKEHFRDAIPGTPGSIRTPMRTPMRGTPMRGTPMGTPNARTPVLTPGHTPTAMPSSRPVVGMTPNRSFGALTPSRSTGGTPSRSLGGLTPQRTPARTPTFDHKPNIGPLHGGMPNPMIRTPTRVLGGTQPVNMYQSPNIGGHTPSMLSPGTSPSGYNIPTPGRSTPGDPKSASTPTYGQMSPSIQPGWNAQYIDRSFRANQFPSNDRPPVSIPTPERHTSMSFPNLDHPPPSQNSERLYPNMPPPPPRIKPNVSHTSHVATDWAQAALNWRKQKETVPSPNRTPTQHPRSIPGTPTSDMNSDYGDATPLIDEH